MTTRISNRDWEALSAYLDGQLNPKQRARLDTRLQDSAELRTALDQLRKTRTLLRSQPRLRAPRNFTLTPEMAGLHTGRRALPSFYPALRLAFTLATVLVMVLFVGELFAGPLQPVSIAQLQQSEVARQPVVPGMGGGGGGGDSGPPMEVPAEAEEAMVEAQDETVVEKEVPEEEQAELGLAEPEQAAPVERLETPLVEGESNQFAVPPTELPPPAILIQPEVMPTPWEGASQADQSPELTDEAMPQPQGLTLLRVIEIALVILAVTMGVALFLMRRSTG
jgi:anti-sigma factor RsiW